ncbi:MAG TPA: peptidoglycan recognition family protein [Pseudonocardiaceae bacterium]|jgi:N-acetyl-anhydromuramyl-L-alanine amidase AmpD|nr:peptidoglycan recognition family protein [Pseudonocardiaceae bacterium]
MPRRRPLTAVLLTATALAAALLGSGPATAEPPAAQAADKPECPAGLDCRFIPAAYAQTDPADPNAYGNYDPANRPRDGVGIRYLVIHDTEESYDSAIAGFQNPNSGVSAHYLIRSADGAVTQLVRTKDIAYHAGNYWFNMHSIGIEHEGVLVDGDRWYTEAMYQASARLVRYLAARYRIPLDREHILSHEELPGPRPDRVAGMHYDPGPYWNWSHYFDLLGAPLPDPRPSAAPVLTIMPRFGSNAQPLQNCAGGTCTDLPPQGSNVVYLHTAPRADAPLVGDPVLHPDGALGTTRVDDWSARAVTGQSFVLAGRSGQWTAIWFGGRRVWFNDPPGQVSAPGRGALVIPRPGRARIAVYGAAYPEAAAYPPTIPVTAVVPLQYTIPAGQVYRGVGNSPGTYYYARFDGAKVPDNHTLIVGNRRFVEISFNHRRAFVDAADVLVLP